MEILESVHDEWYCMTVKDRLDTVTAPTMEEAGLKALTAHQKLALDFSQLAYISSAGLRVLLILGKKAKADNRAFVLCGLRGMVKEVLEESGLDAFFASYDNITDLP